MSQKKILQFFLIFIAEKQHTFVMSTKATGRIFTKTKIRSFVDLVAGIPATPGNGSIASICNCHKKSICQSLLNIMTPFLL